MMIPMAWSMTARLINAPLLIENVVVGALNPYANAGTPSMSGPNG
jgi:hypothetical protein